MDRLQRIRRLHVLKEQLLKRCEQDQRAAENQLRKEETHLKTIEDMEIAALCARDSATVAAEMVAWHQYAEYLEGHESQQAVVLNDCYETLEAKRERTAVAFIEAKRWENHENRTTSFVAADLEHSQQRAADDLAALSHGRPSLLSTGGQGGWK